MHTWHTMTLDGRRCVRRCFCVWGMVNTPNHNTADILQARQVAVFRGSGILHVMCCPCARPARHLARPPEAFQGPSAVPTCYWRSSTHPRYSFADGCSLPAYSWRLAGGSWQQTRTRTAHLAASPFAADTLLTIDLPSAQKQRSQTCSAWPPAWPPLPSSWLQGGPSHAGQPVACQLARQIAQLSL